MIESGMTESQSISLVSNGCSHLNGIGSFRAFAKTGLVRFLEMLKHTFVILGIMTMPISMTLNF